MRVIAEDLRQRVNSGANGLPSIPRINDLMNGAIADIDNIDLPTGAETPEQQLRRLHLSPALLALARDETN